MSVYRVFSIKWYHILFGLLGLIGIVAGVVLVLIAGKGPDYFVSDETDITA
jgi:uncharacterized membrane protein